MKKHDIGDIFALIFILAAIYVLVRPGSIASQLLIEFTNGFTAIVKFAIEG